MSSAVAVAEIDLVGAMEQAKKGIDNELDRLRKKRSEIAEILTLISQDAPIAATQESQASPVVVGGGTVRELGDAVTWDSPVPLSKGDIAVGIMKLGYKTKSDTKSFITSVYNSFINPYCAEGILVPVGDRGDTKYERTDRNARRTYKK